MTKLHLLTQIAYSNETTLLNTYELTLQVQNIDGCLVECGVASGAQLMAMILTGTAKDVIGFDSFEGIPMASEHDTEQPGIGPVTEVLQNRMVSSGITVHSVENVLENFAKFEIPAYRLRLIKGWFCNTIPKFKPVPIALLRLDGDLYESTLTCLQYLYPMVSVGGVVIIDDYGLSGCRKAVHEYFGNHMPELISVPDGAVVYFYKK